MAEKNDRPMRVFLCHATDDKPIVRQLYKFLRKNGVDAWLDEEKLIPGQEWEIEIPKAIKSSDAIIVCLSKHSITKEGYIQKEIRFALDVADEKPDGTIFIIPSRLEECEVPNRLSKWQWLDLYGEHGGEKLMNGLKVRAESLGLAISRAPLPDAVLPPPRKPSVSAVYLFQDKANSPVFPLKMSSVQQTWAKIEFVNIPAGEFIMGSKLSNQLADSSETPQHIVEISYDYWIGRFPVTNAQFAEFVEWTRYNFTWLIKDWKRKLDHPVVHVSWRDIEQYLIWLNENYGKQLPHDLVFRLPSEAEWEKAARGQDGREWPWSNQFDKSKCNSSEGHKKSTTSVGQYSPQGDSPYGVSDMAGNVWEWTCSLHENYPYDTKDGRETSDGITDIQSIRGGSFAADFRHARTAFRDFDTNFRLGSRSAYLYEYKNVPLDLGFRVVVAPPLS